MLKDTKRAVRRHHAERYKAKAKRVYYFLSPQQAAKYADHIKVCSCYACGNVRKHHGASLAERRAKQTEE